MTTLAARLEDAGGQRELLHSSELAVPAAEMLPPRDAVVAICRASPRDFVRDLIALDGNVAGLLLIAPALPAGTVATLMRQTGATVLRTDRADLGELATLPPAAIADALPGETAWYMTTSGTTGIPKVVRHNLASLTRSVRATDPADPPRWGLLYEASRFAGLQVVLQSLIGGGTLLAPDPHGSASDRLRFLAAGGCTHLSATPTLWRQLLMLPEAASLPLRQVTLGGEIADAGILRVLAARFPAARISHIYASTEAGVGFSVRDGQPGFPAAWLDDGVGGALLRIVDGVLWIRPPGARGDGGTAAHIVTDDDGYVCTGDFVRVDGDRATFLGRGSSVVNIGGTKVHPEDVEAVVNAHPQVAGCRIIAKPSAILGAILTLTVVPHDDAGDAAVLRAALKDWLRERLPREAQPATIRIVDQLATTAAGKIARMAG